MNIPKVATIHRSEKLKNGNACRMTHGFCKSCKLLVVNAVIVVFDCVHLVDRMLFVVRKITNNILNSITKSYFFSKVDYIRYLSRFFHQKNADFIFYCLKYLLHLLNYSTTLTKKYQQYEIHCFKHRFIEPSASN